MNVPMVDLLRQMPEEEKEINLEPDDGKTLKINVGKLDKDAGKLLHMIRAMFGEQANDPDWVSHLLTTAQWWLILGCAVGEKESPDPGLKEMIPPIPKKHWTA